MSDDLSARHVVRPAAVAGLFYPDDANALAAMIDRDLSRSGAASAPPGRPPKAIVAPHAGYVYSGPIAARAYARLLPYREVIRRVVLLGPAHRVPLRGLALSSADAWITPLGEIELDQPAEADIVDLPGVTVDDRAHADEHSLEVQVPFLQRTLGGDWRLVPLVVGRASAGEVGAVLDRLWGGPETAIVVSTDLSHYHDDDTAKRLDRATAAEIVARRPEAIEPAAACGAYPLRGLLDVARRRDLEVELIDLRSSADTAGDRHRVVGYGAFAVS